MTPEQWQQVKQVFNTAMDTDPKLRETLLAQICSDQPEIENEVRRMLAASESVGFLDSPPVNVAEMSRILNGLSSTFEPKQTLAGRFRIERYLGSGGMGEVWEAYDDQLCELVAIKTIRGDGLLDPKSIDRFKHEVQRTRQVTHPNVCRVHDLFFHDSLPFLTMELIRGETLAQRIGSGGRLAAEDATSILVQCAAGLEAAHAVGLIHRDLKPANIMLAPDGRAVVMDFGLALIRRGLGESTIPIAGTPAYMAPEQASGGAVTTAADVYSFSVLACEALTAKRPAEGGLALLSSAWRVRILPGLNPDPSSRPLSPSSILEVPRIRIVQLLAICGLIVLFAVGAALSWRLRFDSTAQVTPMNRKIAVLPFENVGTGNIGNLIADELITSLTRVRELRVVARYSTNHVYDSKEDPSSIAKRFGARYLVTGTVREHDGRMRVSVQLVDAQAGVQIWAENYDRLAKDALETERQIARTLVAQMGIPSVDIYPPRPLTNGGTAYLNGRYHLNHRVGGSALRAVNYLEQSIRLSPDLAEAHAALAEALIVLAEARIESSITAVPRARASAERALLIDPRLAEAYASLGFLAAAADHNFESAEKNFLHALNLNPNLSLARQWYSYTLVRVKRFQEALDQASKAVEIDPLSMPAQQNLAMIFYYSRDWPKLRIQCEKLLELDSNHFFAHLLLAHASALSSDPVEMEKQLSLAAKNRQDPILFTRAAAEAYGFAQLPSKAKPLLDKLLLIRPSISATYAASALAASGRVDESFKMLEKAWLEQDLFLPMLAVYPAFDSLRDDPRYQSFLDRLGIKVNTAPDSVRPH